MHGGAVEGCVSRTVADTAAVLDTISAFDPTAWYNAPAPSRPFLHEVGADPGRLRIAVTTTPVLAMPVAPACADAVRRAADLCAGLDHDVFEHQIAWPDPDALIGAFLSLWRSGTAGIRDIDWDRVEPLDAALRAQAKEMDCVTYVEAIMTLQLATRSFVPQWGRDFDVLLTPTMAVEPLRVGELWEGSDADPTVALVNAYPMAIFTSIFNVTGQPAMSLAVHVADSGLPVGVQIIGAPWDEATLIRLASQLEPVAGWLDRRPPIHA